MAVRDMITVPQLSRLVGTPDEPPISDARLAADQAADPGVPPAAANEPLVRAELPPAPDPRRRTVWVTRARPKIDRIACPWLIRRFIEADAEFLYVPTDRVFAVARETGAIPYDIPGAEPFAHDGELCSFDALIKHYGLKDSGLERLALIVRGADTARHDLAPEASGLHAISMGLSANIADDHAMLEQGMVIYDALYSWCRDAKAEIHNWTPGQARPSASAV